MKTERRARRFWIWGFVFLFLAHAAAIFRFSERDASAPWRPPSRPFFYFSLDASSDARVAQLTAGQDPTLFALPNSRGFSGGAWLNFRPEVLKLSNWSAPPDWLDLPTEQLGLSLREYVATNRASEERLLSSLRMPNHVEVRVPDEPVASNTSVRVEGPLVARKIVAQPILPSATHSDVLRKTVVAISVNGDGLVETAFLSSESGSRDADERAVEIARQFSFEPAAIRNARARETTVPTLGRLVFTWHVMPPLPANATAARTP